MKYVNVVAAFDIETSSFKDNDTKKAYAYTYTFTIEDETIVFRTELQFQAAMALLAQKYETNDDHRLVIWVHNLAYEWQFIKHMLSWKDGFVNGSERKVIRATTNSGIEFRCTYALTNTSLAKVGDDVGIEKMEGDLDYLLMRHSSTDLTEEELAYIHHDTEIIVALIRDRLRNDTLETIPMTATSYVRRDVREACKATDGYMNTREALMDSLRLDSESYNMTRQAFAGGYTHASFTTSGQVCENVVAYDLSSSYPSSLCQFPYPAESFAYVNGIDTLEDYSMLGGGFAALMDVTITDLMSAYTFPYISSYKCIELINADLDNGRVYSADRVRLTITDIDLKIIERNYPGCEVSVNRILISAYEPLPKPLVSKILSYYEAKTTLKGVEGREEDYKLGKERGNSIYGMMASDPIRENFELAGTEFVHNPVSLDEAIAQHNDSKNRFLFYPWGTWCTAYSRSILLEAIMDAEDAELNVIYCDTDSIYVEDSPEVAPLILGYNQAIDARLRANLAFVGLSDQEIEAGVNPVDIKGKHHLLGEWDCETPEPLKQFKTLGAKRYAKIDHEGNFHITVSGLTKSAASYVEANGAMDFFCDGMHIPAEHAGRTISTYVDDAPYTLKAIDYRGEVDTISARSWIHIEPSDYHLSVSDEYAKFIGLRS